MAEAAKPEGIRAPDIDVSREPAGPSPDVKANEAAQEEGAKVGKENGELRKQKQPQVEEEVDANDRGEESTSPRTKEKVEENAQGEPSSSPKTEDNLDAKEKVHVSSPNAEEKQGDAVDVAGETSSSVATDKGDYLKSDESDLLSDLKENERKALEELRSIVEEAILANKLFQEKKREQKEEPDPNEEESKKCEPKEKQIESIENEKHNDVYEGKSDRGKAKVEDEEEEVKCVGNDAGVSSLCIWGVPLMPSRGHKGTDVILLKFLKAREFKVNDAWEMLRSTLQYRKENNIDSILEEDFGCDYESMCSMSGVDRRGHPVCYNVYAVFGNDDLYNKTFGTQEGREKFLRWRLQLMERQIQKLDFRPEGVSSLLQINDLKDAPGPSRKDLRLALRQAVALLQENYPEFVATNIFINVPFWYYAFNALLSPFLTQRTKSKFVFARANRVTETLLKYIAGEEIPVNYGGLKRENDPDFSTDDGVFDVTVKAGSTETIEIPTPKAGSTLVWDLTVIGWEVNYKEEFVPSNESSYTIIVKKERRIGWQEGSVRNSFKSNEPGKVVITIENGQFRRKRVLYRYKIKDASLCSSSC
nr:patellin-4-like [Coffea arabica]